MNTIPQQPLFREARNSNVPLLIAGPFRLLTAKFNSRNAACMIALSIPALLMTALMTLPAILFNTPQHNEYFEFAKELGQGGDHWFAMGLSTCCSLLCFAVPCDSSREIACKRKA